MRKVPVAERLARLGLRHDLARLVASVGTAASDMVALHSSDPVTVHLSAFARVRGFTPADLERALYERKTLVRMLGMRRTLFVVPLDVAAVMDEACTKALVPGQRRRLAMRPGITGLWQVSGRNAVDFEGWMQMDLLYVDRWSLGLDLRILLRTIPVVLRGAGAS